MEPINNTNSQAEPQNPVSVPLNPPVTPAPPEPVMPVPPTFIPPTPPTPPTPEPTFIPPVVISPPAPTASMPPAYTSNPEAPKTNSWKTFFLILLGMVVIGVAICAFIGYRNSLAETPSTAESDTYLGGDKDDDDDVMPVTGFVDDRVGVDTSSWPVVKNYMNSEFGFILQFPDGWKVDAESPHSFLSPEGQQIRETEPGQYYDIRFYVAIASRIDELMTSSSKSPSEHLGPNKVLNGISYRTYLGDGIDCGSPDIYEIKHNGYFYGFQACSNSRENVPIMESILSTLKFTK